MSIPNTTPSSGFWHRCQKFLKLQYGFLRISQITFQDPRVVEIPVSLPFNQILNLALDHTFIHKPFYLILTALIYQKRLLLLDIPMNCLELRNVEHVVNSPLRGQCQLKSYWTYNLNHLKWPRKQSCQFPCPRT
jgi:hypothetical protein